MVKIMVGQNIGTKNHINLLTTQKVIIYKAKLLFWQF